MNPSTAIATATATAIIDVDVDVETVFGAERVACPFCLASVGEGCLTTSGAPTSSHRARWSAYEHRMRSGSFVVRIKSTDERLGVTSGEEYVAERYWLDPAKVSLLARVGDGYDPGCNQYGSDITWVRWEA